MDPNVNRRWLLSKRPKGAFDESNFSCVESPAPSPEKGQVLVRNLWISLDPTSILFTNETMENLAVPIGGVMRCIASGRIIESKLEGFQPGDLVQGFFGWEDYSVIPGGILPDGQPMTKIPAGVSPQRAVGTLGITGMAAYFGVLEVGKPKPGETFVVSSAAGGVGSVAGQIAKIKGLKVIGITSGAKRRDRLLSELGFDGVIDLNNEDIATSLDSLCPDGIDIFFDNNALPIVVNAALKRLRHLGRVVLCGLTAYYLGNPTERVEYTELIMKRGRMEGLLASEFEERFPEAREDLASWISSGQLKPLEDIVNGLEKAPYALQRVFNRENYGKQLLKISD